MSNMDQYTIGAEVTCSDGVCGVLQCVVIDPVARVLTHLVVEPKHSQGQGRLVPIDLADSTDQGITLRCTTAEYHALAAAEETHFLPEAGQQMGYGPGQALAWPYYGLGGGMVGMGRGGMGIGGMGIAGMATAPRVVIEDRVPEGEVEIRRGEHVHARDGNIGRVHGLVIDPSDHHVTHLLLEEGHLWGKKQIAIPIGAVKDVAAGDVRLDLSRDEVRDLPPVDLARHG
jgi:sporulation protein YlmC with PRC-barrel domain